MKYILILITILMFSCTIITYSDDCLCGIIYVSGNEPFTFLAFNTRDCIYKIECSDNIKKELWQLQGQNINICDYDVILRKQ